MVVEWLQSHQPRARARDKAISRLHGTADAREPCPRREARRRLIPNDGKSRLRAWKTSSLLYQIGLGSPLPPLPPQRHHHRPYHHHHHLLLLLCLLPPLPLLINRPAPSLAPTCRRPPLSALFASAVRRHRLRWCREACAILPRQQKAAEPRPVCPPPRMTTGKRRPPTPRATTIPRHCDTRRPATVLPSRFYL